MSMLAQHMVGSCKALNGKPGKAIHRCHVSAMYAEQPNSSASPHSGSGARLTGERHACRIANQRLRPRVLEGVDHRRLVSPVAVLFGGVDRLLPTTGEASLGVRGERVTAGSDIEHVGRMGARCDQQEQRSSKHYLHRHSPFCCCGRSIQRIGRSTAVALRDSAAIAYTADTTSRPRAFAAPRPSPCVCRKRSSGWLRRQARRWRLHYQRFPPTPAKPARGAP